MPLYRCIYVQEMSRNKHVLCEATQAYLAYITIKSNATVSLV